MESIVELTAEELGTVAGGTANGGCPLVDGGNVTVEQFAKNAPTIASEYGPVALIGYASNVVIC